MSKDLTNGKEMRRQGLFRLAYYVEDMCSPMNSLFEKYSNLEPACDEMVHDREGRWDLTEWHEGSFKHTPEGLIEIGEYLLQLGNIVTEVCIDPELLEPYVERFGVEAKYGEDIGFYLVEMGLGLQGLGSLWRIVDPDLEYDMSQLLH